MQYFPAQQDSRSPQTYRVLLRIVLASSAVAPNLAQSSSEFLPKRSHLEGFPKRKSPVVSLRVPPNEITGGGLSAMRHRVRLGMSMKIVLRFGACLWA